MEAILKCVCCKKMFDRGIMRHTLNDGMVCKKCYRSECCSLCGDLCGMILCRHCRIIRG